MEGGKETDNSNSIADILLYSMRTSFDLDSNKHYWWKKTNKNKSLF